MDAAPGGDIVPDVLCGSAQLMDAAPGGDIVPDVVCSSAQLMDAGNVVPTSLRPTSFVPTVGVKCEVSTVLIRGEVQVGIYQGEKVLLGYRVGKIESAKHYLEPWICAVAKAAGGQGMRTCLIAENHVPTPLILDAIEPEEAATILGCLVQGFLEGRLRPLCYAPGTSDEYVKRITSTTRPKTPEEALGAMADQWNAVGRNGSPDGEGRSKTAMLAWRDQEAFAVRYHEAWKNWAEQIGKPLRSWFNP